MSLCFRGQNGTRALSTLNALSSCMMMMSLEFPHRVHLGQVPLDVPLDVLRDLERFYELTPDSDIFSPSNYLNNYLKGNTSTKLYYLILFLLTNL